MPVVGTRPCFKNSFHFRFSFSFRRFSITYISFHDPEKQLNFNRSNPYYLYYSIIFILLKLISPYFINPFKKQAGLSLVDADSSIRPFILSLVLFSAFILEIYVEGKFSIKKVCICYRLFDLRGIFRHLKWVLAIDVIIKHDAV